MMLVAAAASRPCAKAASVISSGAEAGWLVRDGKTANRSGKGGKWCQKFSWIARV
jgi:hypothetical protein